MSGWKQARKESRRRKEEVFSSVKPSVPDDKQREYSKTAQVRSWNMTFPLLETRRLPRFYSNQVNHPAFFVLRK
jgi:hypothetical protein